MTLASTNSLLLKFCFYLCDYNLRILLVGFFTTKGNGELLFHILEFKFLWFSTDEPSLRLRLHSFFNKNNVCKILKLRIAEI